MTCIEKLRKAWHTNNSLVCVGLDPIVERLPQHLKGADTNSAIFEFNKAIIDATADLVCAFKPQFAHYAAESAEAQLKQTIDYIKSRYPEVPVLLDAKRGDIGSTAEMYAREAFDRYGADALTVNPYLGRDSLEPYLSRADKGVIILCRTSNPGAADLQDLVVEDEPLYQRLAGEIATEWDTNKNCMLVVGATWPEQLSKIRLIVGDDMPLLVPGVGAQGGSAAEVVANGASQSGDGLIISSSRAILYASDGVDFAEAARKACLDLRDEINEARAAL